MIVTKTTAGPAGATPSSARTPGAEKEKDASPGGASNASNPPPLTEQDRQRLRENLINDPDNVEIPHGDPQIFGDVQPKHCRVHNFFGYWHVSALEDKIGTLVDGQKIRASTDGPQPLRDGSVIQLGKTLVLCEMGDLTQLTERRNAYYAKVIGEVGGLSRGGSAASGGDEAAQRESVHTEASSAGLSLSRGPSAVGSDHSGEEIQIGYGSFGSGERETLLPKEGEEPAGIKKKRRWSDNPEEAAKRVKE